MAEFILTIQTPKETIFQGKATLITVRTEEGYLGLMANHLPILAKLKEGNFKADSKEYGLITGTLYSGFLFFHNNEALILTNKNIKLHDSKTFNQFEVPEFRKEKTNV